MPPISSIRRLSPELRRAIEEQLADGHSLDEITAHVRALGGNASRSAIWRYKKGFEAVLARAERNRQITEVLVRSRAGTEEKEMIQGGVEVLQGLILAAVEGLDEAGKKVSPENAMKLAIALEKTARAAKTGAELEKLRALNAREIVDADATPASERQRIEVTFMEPAKTPDVDKREA